MISESRFAWSPCERRAEQYRSAASINPGSGREYHRQTSGDQGRQARPPVARLALLAGPLDATLNFMKAAGLLLEPLPVRNGESLAQKAGVFEHGINDAEVAGIGLRAEELVEGQSRTRFRPGRRHRRAPRTV